MMPLEKRKATELRVFEAQNSYMIEKPHPPTVLLEGSVNAQR